jgi:[NiFe] hydrogenase assembly HybE family chaperone
MTGHSLFEGSFLGDASRISATARMECGICWTIYDPAEGDPVWQVPPGTPFATLPEHWRCPTCDAEKHKFMVLDGGQPVGLFLADALATAYRRIAQAQMSDLPVYNDKLAVEAIGFRRHGDGWIGIMVTPWFMNAVLAPIAPGAWDLMRDGTKSLHNLPSGAYEFVAGRIEGVGTIQSCSLFSPMFEFEEQEAVRLTAEAALAALLEPAEEDSVPAAAEPPAPPAPSGPAEMSRRHLLRGSFGG